MVKIRPYIILLFLLLFFSAKAGHGAVVEIVIDKHAIVSSSSVTLSEIADFKGKSGDMDDLKALRLGASPAPGRYRILKKKRIEAFLARRGFVDVAIIAPEKIHVWRKAERVSASTISKEVEQAIYQKMPWSKEKVSLLLGVPNDEIALPSGNATIKVAIPRSFNYLGRELVRVDLFVEGKKERSLWVKTDMKVLTDIIVASRPILRNEILGKNDIEVEQRLISSLRKELFARKGDIVGMRVKRSIRKGDLIIEDDVALPPIIRRGNMVNIVAEKGPVLIRTKGKALEKGFKGKMMKVENINSKKKILAEVVDSKTVRINF